MYSSTMVIVNFVSLLAVGLIASHEQEVDTYSVIEPNIVKRLRYYLLLINWLKGGFDQVWSILPAL